MSKCYVILKSDNAIKSVSNKNDTVLLQGESLDIQNKSLEDFVNSLPDHPSKCKKNGDNYILNTDFIDIKNYNDKDFKEWLLEEFGMEMTMAAYYAAMSDLLIYKNFGKFKLFADYLLSINQVTQEMYDKVITKLSGYNDVVLT